jgi:hypothetical protein
VREPPMDLYQLSCPTTMSVRDDHVDVSGAKLSRPFLICRVGRYRDQHPDLRDPCSWGQSECWLQPGPLKGRGHSPYVSLLELIFIYLCQFLLFNAYAFLCRILGMHAAARVGSPCLRMQ